MSTSTTVDLTLRETQIAELIAHGAQRKEVANWLKISIHTVGNTLKKVYKKTNSTSIGQLAQWWWNTKNISHAA